MLLLWKRGCKCEKYIGKPTVDHTHHFLLGQVFELDNLGLGRNLEKIWNYWGKFKGKKFGGKIMR
jgi:hypothetical protein